MSTDLLSRPAGLHLYADEYRIGRQHGRQLAVVDGVARPLIAGGAVGNSGGYISTWKKPNDGSDLIIDWVNDAIKAALYANTITPNFSTDTVYSTTGEITGTGYTAAGVALTGKTCTESPTGTIMLDANDPSWTSATFSGVRCTILHDTTLVTPTDPLLLLVTFGADFAVTAGTFTVQVAATGFIANDITP